MPKSMTTPHRLALASFAAFVALPLHAQMAQDPLLSRTAAVEPNIVLMFDDSGSMNSTAIYQYGGDSGYQGLSGPNDDPLCNSLTNCVWTGAPNTKWGQSPDVNLIYYDPRVTYTLQVNADGTNKAAGVPPSSGFGVYFHKPPTTTNYGVSAIGVSKMGSGYPATGVTGTLPAPSAGGTQARVTVNVTSSMTASTVTMTNRGTGYPSSGVTPIFSPPPAGGVLPTATVFTGNSTTVQGVTVTNKGGYANAGVTAVFTTAPPGGITAEGTVVMESPVTNRVLSATASAGGSGYTAASTVTFNTPAGGTPAVGTLALASATQSVTAVNFTTGVCYPTGSPPTITFPAPPAGGVRATATLTMVRGSCANTARQIQSIAVNTNYGYASAPAPSVTGGGATTFTTVYATSQAVTGVNFTSFGSGYSSAPVPAFGGPGSGAALVFTMTPLYRVARVDMTNFGAGYTGGVTVAFTPATGVGAVTALGTVATQTARGITGVTINTPGSGYTSPPIITGWNNASGGTGAAGTVNTGTTNVISSITVDDAGSGYTSVPTPLNLQGTGSGTGATFTYTPLPITVQPANRPWDGKSAANVDTAYFTTDYLPDSGSPLATGADATIRYPNATTTGRNYPKFKNRTDCVTSTSYCTATEEFQNYANWKLYHNTRIKLAKTGLGRAFQPLNPTFRLGWSTINNLYNNSRLDSGVNLFNSTTQAAFLSWLDARTSSPNNFTPNRYALDRVGQYYQRGDDAGPWSDSPSASSTAINVSGDVTTHASCRRSYSILMTDGYYNDEYPLSTNFSIADFDSSASGSLNPSFQYKPVGPFSDTKGGTAFSNSFADVAMKYWLSDLRKNVTNGIKPVPGDEANWQHMNFYAIGLGLVGGLDANDPATLQGLTGDLINNPKRTLDWPAPKVNQPAAIDDMWHATINGRGKMLNAKTAKELNTAILQMMSDISGKEATQSGVAVSTASLTQGTKKYTPNYTSITWNGNVTAYNLNEKTGDQAGIAWQVEKEISTDPNTGVKTYQSSMPAADVRNIFVGNGAVTGTPRAVEFKYNSMGTLLGSMTGTVTKDMINYLRGDATKEHTSTSESDPSAIFRARATRLGDIVNSTPVFVKSSTDLNYNKLPAASPFPVPNGYRDFVDGTGAANAKTGGKAQRAEGVLFVGANDGMLHAFRDGNAIDPGGIEVFAYVPNALLPTLNQLSDEAYVHRYYVDGPNTETDAYVGGAWKNIILGTTGAGAGKAGVATVSSPRTAVYAIDVTSLNTSVTGLGASNVMWEISSNQANFAELGYVLTDVQAGPSMSSSDPWIAVVNNGYDSKSCKAMLYVINLATGARVREIDTGVGACTTNATKNGLGGVRIVRDDNQRIIGAYAGDLQGNLWKFDLRSTDASTWKAIKLLKAGPAKPFTAQPAILPLTDLTVPSTGYMVVAGTGKFFEISDINTTTQQTLYGIWDSLPFGTTTAPVIVDLPTDISSLQVQTIGSSTTIGGKTFAQISDNDFSYTGASAKRGWYMDFVKTGQRLVYPIDLLADKFVAADTISPSNVSADPCINQGAGSSFLYIVDAITGKRPVDQIFDTNGDGSVNDKDLVVSGMEGRADGRNVTLLLEKTALETKLVNVSGGDPGGTLIKFTCLALGNCPNPVANTIKSRTWRQLFMR